MNPLAPRDQVALLLSLLSPSALQSILRCSNRLNEFPADMSPAVGAESQSNLIGFVGVMLELNLVPDTIKRQISEAYSWAATPQWLEELQFEAQLNDPSVPKIVNRTRGAVIGVALNPDLILSKDEYIRRSFVELVEEFALTSPARMAALLEYQLDDGDSDGQNFA
jgi:hypothetical protein